MNAASPDEDCLYVNVWTPNLTPAAPLPVMFWIHGGGNQNGSANEPVPYAGSGLFYSGQFMAESQGVVVVTLNYRLGAFGFFTNAALDQEEGGVSGNQGLWDQTLALQWAQANVAKFGGDPKNVTIYGESAGSLDVCLHVASPKSRGLFTKAISQSGGCATKNTLKAAAATTADTFATGLGCTGATALECLRAKPVADILGLVTTSAARFGNIVDGEFLPKQPRELFDAGDVAKVPYILGSNTDEGTLFTLTTSVPTEEALKTSLMTTFPGADIAAILAAYPLSNFASQPNPLQAALARIVGDAQLVCSTWDAAARMEKLGAGVWMYNFDVPVVIATMPNLGLGASHGAELSYVFQTSPAFTAEQVTLSNTMQTYWANFAKTGDPNGGSLLAWPKFTEAASTRINFAIAPTIVEAFRKTECQFWRARYDAQFAAAP
jgi:para-nitrobenzyl esterase